MTILPKVYLAGPGVFRPNANTIGAELKAFCASEGLEGLWPLDNDHPADVHAIFAGNVVMIRDCDAVVADLSPFRGPHMDVGTAWEIGFAHALGKEVFGYSTAHEPTRSTVHVLRERVPCKRYDDFYRDAQGDLVEDFGLVENLMISCSARPQVASSAQSAIARCATYLRSRS